MSEPAAKLQSMQQASKMFQSVKPEEATLVQEGEHNNSCVRCGMNLTKFYKTSHTATYNDKNVQYCSIHCLAEHLNEGVELKNPHVVDVTSLKLLPVLEVYYVVGSNKRGTMSRVSKYAFLNLEDAKKFQKENGGKIMDFNAALEVAKKDF
jgi:nitrous oxide reductase accessory protein NosL